MTLEEIKMINMVKLEIYKLKRLNLFKILLLFVIVISILSAFSALNLTGENGERLTGRLQYAENFHDIAMLLVNAIFAGVYIGSDFSNRTIQSQISRGQTRKNIVMSKTISFILATNVIIVLYPTIGAAVITFKNGWGELITRQEILYILLVTLEGLILNIGTSSFFILFVFIFRDVPKSICCCLAFPVLFSIIKPLLADIPVINILVNLMTLSQNRNIGTVDIKEIVMIICSTIFTFTINYCLITLFFRRAEIK